MITLPRNKPHLQQCRERQIGNWLCELASRGKRVRRSMSQRKSDAAGDSATQEVALPLSARPSVSSKLAPGTGITALVNLGRGILRPYCSLPAPPLERRRTGHPHSREARKRWNLSPACTQVSLEVVLLPPATSRLPATGTQTAEVSDT